MINETCPWCGAKRECGSPEDVIKTFACASYETPIVGLKEQSRTCKARCKDQLIAKQKRRIEYLEEETDTCQMLCMRVERKNKLIAKQEEKIKELREEIVRLWNDLSESEEEIVDLQKKLELAAEVKIICNSCGQEVPETLDGKCIECVYKDSL